MKVLAPHGCPKTGQFVEIQEGNFVDTEEQLLGDRIGIWKCPHCGWESEPLFRVRSAVPEKSS